MKVVLISTYDGGHQPFGLASPAAQLRAVGADVSLVDLAVQQMPSATIRSADVIAFYLPMHTATRLAATHIPRVRTANPDAHLCCFGLYAPLNAEYLRSLGAHTVIGGEFEPGLVALYNSLSSAKDAPASQEVPLVLLDKQPWSVPDRSGLPGLTAYAHLDTGDGTSRTAGYTEASRGCKHHCRHCPIVPVYEGRFRVVPRPIVLEDIRRQVAAGAQHITFGDPDFLNGPGHAIPLVEALHAEFPDLTYDATIKIEHLLQHADLLPMLSETGCLFITSAVEAIDDTILTYFDKRHTVEDFRRAVGLLRGAGIQFNPTFVTFTPWTTRQGYLALLDEIEHLGLIENIAPVQYAIRLLIPAGSKLLDLAEVRALVKTFDQDALSYPWSHPDPAMDQLYASVRDGVQRSQARGESRRTLFERVRALASGDRPQAQHQQLVMLQQGYNRPPPAVPRLSEPWFC